VPLLALFDVDGTLFLTHDELSGKAMVASLREVYGVSLADDAVDRVEHLGLAAKRIAREVLSAAGLEDEAIDERLDRWCRRFSEAYLELLAGADTSGWKARPGAVDALASLERAGVRLALLTGNPEPVARARMERLGLARFFPEREGAFGCEAEERRDLLGLARRRAGGWPAEWTIEIGDTPLDVTSAHEAGLRSIVIRSPRSERESFANADAVVEDMDSLARTLVAWAALLPFRESGGPPGGG
jgi:phosphoglycolate phosphatase-like HAD superfamily hydrolase